jgi:hypothetical protein
MATDAVEPGPARLMTYADVADYLGVFAGGMLASYLFGYWLDSMSGRAWEQVRWMQAVDDYMRLKEHIKQRRI